MMPGSPQYLWVRDTIIAFDYSHNGKPFTGCVEVMFNKYRRSRISNVVEGSVAVAAAVQDLKDRDPDFTFHNFKPSV